MLTVLASLVIGMGAQGLAFTPTDDVWVYPHASDPQRDGYLRVWGVEGQAVAADPTQADEFSYSFVKFDLSKLPAGSKIKSAVLTLTHTPDPTWQASDAKAAPLEARLLKGDFSEKSWDFGLGKSIFPVSGKEAVLGSFAPSKVAAGQPISFEVDLMKGPAKFALADGKVAFALTSTLDPSAIGNRAVYKFYSKDYDKPEYRPKLTIAIE
jgi:hypothetical protein